MDTSYTPVAYEFREDIEAQIASGTSGKIFFWGADGKLDEVVGRAVKLEDRPCAGLFLVLDSGAHVRIDRIIILYGKIGAAYGEYEAYGNQCLACTAGVPL